MRAGEIGAFLAHTSAGGGIAGRVAGAATCFHPAVERIAAAAIGLADAGPAFGRVVVTAARIARALAVLARLAARTVDPAACVRFAFALAGRLVAHLLVAAAPKVHPAVEAVPAAAVRSAIGGQTFTGMVVAIRFRLIGTDATDTSVAAIAICIGARWRPGHLGGPGKWPGIAAPGSLARCGRQGADRRRPCQTEQPLEQCAAAVMLCHASCKGVEGSIVHHGSWFADRGHVLDDIRFCLDDHHASAPPGMAGFPAEQALGFADGEAGGVTGERRALVDTGEEAVDQRLGRFGAKGIGSGDVERLESKAVHFDSPANGRGGIAPIDIRPEVVRMDGRIGAALFLDRIQLG